MGSWVLIGRLVVFIQLVTGVLSWGKDGHFATCKIAEGYLSEEALAAVKELLPESAEGELANVCSWADQVRFGRRWSSALHFSDTPDDKCNYDYSRDCHDSVGRENRCVTGAIFNYTDQLVSGYQNPKSVFNYNLTESLMFLAHFMGDVHQPLHVGFIGDLGGNEIELRWFRRKANLHQIWDNLIIESALKTFYDRDLDTMIQAIQANMTGDWSIELQEWENCQNKSTVCPNLYASESINLACEFAYKDVKPEITLEDDYFLSRLPIVEERLAQGGIRLAATLNRIFGSPVKIAQT